MSTMNMKRILAAGVAAVTMFSLAACGSTAADPNKGHVYFLNGKPEVVDQLQQLAQDYTKQTGVQVVIDVDGAASDPTLADLCTVPDTIRCRILY